MSNSILVTGATGSFGRAFIKNFVSSNAPIERLVVYSRDELKQYEMQQQFPVSTYPFIRYFLGDIRDEARLEMALKGIDTVIHAAALKQVPAAEYNPFEFIRTNILGAENLIRACLNSDVSQVIALSTDKAAAPVNLYGATKLCSDKLFIAANNLTGNKDLKFSVVRYGNVMGSRGSVIPFFLKSKIDGPLPVTDPAMTRFNISLREGVEMVEWAMRNALGGEIFVPKIPSYRILDLVEAITPGESPVIVGIRSGEKLHEEMITLSDSPYTIDIGDYYTILPSMGKYPTEAYLEKFEGRFVPENFQYSSDTNPVFLSVNELRDLIEKHVSSVNS
jgi:UDP-N-acetylglucosamine 4,6-dehydratase